MKQIKYKTHRYSGKEVIGLSRQSRNERFKNKNKDKHFSLLTFGAQFESQNHLPPKR